jgi:hypothetical protein
VEEMQNVEAAHIGYKLASFIRHAIQNDQDDHAARHRDGRSLPNLDHRVVQERVRESKEVSILVRRAVEEGEGSDDRPHTEFTYLDPDEKDDPDKIAQSSGEQAHTYSSHLTFPRNQQ